MVPAIFKYFKKRNSFDSKMTLRQWQENSFIFVYGAICIMALPAFINSSILAIQKGMWGNLIAFIAGYFLCIVITIFRSIPFRIRVWTGLLVFIGLGCLSLFTMGPIGSGRIWLFSTTVFATLTLGIRSGALVIVIQAAVLSMFYYFLRTDLDFWAKLGNYSPGVWVTTSVTLMFLSIVSMFAMGRLIRGISMSLEESRKNASLLRETTSRLSSRVEQHNQTILSLKESEKRWHFALEGAGDGVWDWDLLSGRVFYSLQWKKMLGFGKEEIKDDPEEWFSRIHPEDRESVLKILHENIENRMPFFKSRYRLVCKDGSTKWIMDRWKVMDKSPDGSAARIIGTHADITMIIELENQHAEYELRLQQAQKMEAIGTLAGGIAHDFNNILFPILGHSEMLLAEAGDENDMDKKSFKQIHSSALRAKELVQQILTFSRQETTEYMPVQVQTILKEVIKLLRSTIPRNIEIRQSIDGNCRAISADAIQIHQIIMNLATNSYHAMGDTGGELRISLEEVDIDAGDSVHMGVQAGQAVCLAVADTGKGMAPELVNKIFDPFFTTKGKGEGTGMGLSVVHGIVKKMKGYIRVSSELGKGTEFKIYFPAAEPEKPNADRPGDAGPQLSSGDERVLLVDDEEAVLSIEVQALQRLGYTVRAELRPMDALEIFRRMPHEFDVVITDMSMPGMSGQELARHLLKVRPDIPIILCTGFSEKTTPEMVKQMGIRAVIMKPVLSKELSCAIRKVLEGSDSL